MPLYLERAILPLTDGLVAAFLFLLAANIGSFLNVVVHRLPRGESVVRGGSRCPACGLPIRWYDNVPVLGWILLRGRCRDCGTPISPRYPLVEAACACVLGTVASVELLTGGSNLPGGRFGGGRSGGDVLFLHTDWLLLAVCLLHCFLLAAVLAWAIFDFEGKDVPARWVAAAAIVVVMAVGLLPALQPVPAGFPVGDWPPSSMPWRGFIASMMGVAIATLPAACFGNRTLRSGLMLLAAGLGWQAAATIAVLTITAAAARQLPGMLAAGKLQFVRAAAADLVVAAVIHLLLWGSIYHLWVVAGRRCSRLW